MSALVDRPAMQRPRRLEQLGTAFLVCGAQGPRGIFTPLTTSESDLDAFACMCVTRQRHE